MGVVVGKRRVQGNFVTSMTGALDRAGGGACGQTQTGAQLWLSGNTRTFFSGNGPSLVVAVRSHQRDAVGRCPL